MTTNGFRVLNEKSLMEYIKATPSLSSQLGNKLDNLKIKEVGDVAEFSANVEMCRLTEQVVFSDPYKISEYNHWTSPYLDDDAEAVRNDNQLKLEVAELKSMFCENTQALIHGDLHTSSVMVTQDSTQVIDPEFAFYGPMGFDIGASIGNLFLAYFAQDGYADDRKTYKEWIMNTISDTLNLFHKKFTTLWDIHKDGPGEAYDPEVYKDMELRRIVGVAHVEDFESIADPVKRADCERCALDFAKMLMKKRRIFNTITDVISAI